MFWPGIVGEFMRFLPLTLIATLTASLVMALVFVPTLGSVFGKPGGTADPATMKALAAGENGDLHDVKGLTGSYLKILGFALRHPAKIIIAAVAVLVVVMGSYVAFGRGIEFFPDVEPHNAVLQLHARGNFSVDERDQLVRQIEQVVLALQREHGEFHAVSVQSMASSGTRGGDEAEDIIGKITLEFTDWFLRRPANEILTEIRERSEIFAGVLVEARKEEAGPPVGKPVQIQVSSAEPSLIDPVVRRVTAAMNQIGGFIDMEDGAQIPGIEWELVVDRAQAAKFGADISLIGSYVRMVTNGMKLGDYRPDDSSEEIDIVVRLPEQYRTIAQLDLIRMQTSAGMVPISNFVTRVPQQKVGLLRRTDGRRAMSVKADVAPGLLADDKVQEVRAWLATQDFDPRINIGFKGEDEEQKAAMAFLSKAFAVALFLMAIILVTQFNSFYSAFLILTAVIMSTVGVMIGLLVTGQPFGIIMSGIGVIALAGIVVNNNIVLIDTYDRLKATSASPLEAIMRTGAQRLRPVMLTTITTILGLMPMVLGMNLDFAAREIQIGAPSTQWWTQLSTAIAFGLTFATVLTLVVTPSALMLQANFRAWRGKRRVRGSAQPAPSRVTPTEVPRAAE
jgi:multidrug efflux pump